MTSISTFPDGRPAGVALRTGLRALAVICLAAAAAGCDTTPDRVRSGSSSGGGRSGVTVFGDIDAGVARTR